jgi:hypothetical protein
VLIVVVDVVVAAAVDALVGGRVVVVDYSEYLYTSTDQKFLRCQICRIDQNSTFLWSPWNFGRAIIRVGHI